MGGKSSAGAVFGSLKTRKAKRQQSVADMKAAFIAAMGGPRG